MARYDFVTNSEHPCVSIVRRHLDGGDDTVAIFYPAGVADLDFCERQAENLAHILNLIAGYN